MPDNTKPDSTSPERRNRELTIPEELDSFQQDFGAAVSVPFQFDKAGQWRTRGEAYPPALTSRMVPRPDLGLDGVRRLATYNEQYWFRLFSTMRKEYPLLNRLTGAWDFNRLVTDYLEAYPSRSPSLRDLSNDLAAFLADETRWNQPILRQAARLDYLYICAFDAAAKPRFEPAALTAAEQAAVSRKALAFQPHWFLFEEHWPLVRLRQAIVAGEDDGPPHPEPSHGYWTVYRQGTVRVLSLGPLQFRLLTAMRDGLSIEKAVAELDRALNAKQRSFLERNIGSWFAQWVGLGWFCSHEPERPEN